MWADIITLSECRREVERNKCSPRWKTDPLKCSNFPDRPTPFSLLREYVVWMHQRKTKYWYPPWKNKSKHPSNTTYPVHLEQRAKIDSTKENIRSIHKCTVKLEGKDCGHWKRNRAKQTTSYKHRKFSAVLGTTSALSSISILPFGLPPMAISKKTTGLETLILLFAGFLDARVFLVRW